MRSPGAIGSGGDPPATKSSARPICTTGPDASLTKNNKAHRSEPSYKHHTAVDAEHGVVLDVAVTTGAVPDTRTVEDQLTRVAAATGQAIRTATMDASHAITRGFAELEKRNIEAVISAEAERAAKKGTIPVRRFKLDAKNRLVRCPGGKFLRPHDPPDSDGFQYDWARIPDCRSCRLRAVCFSQIMKRRAILLHKDHPALLRARRKCARWGDHERALYRSHRIRVEGLHGEVKTWHRLARAIRRGLANIQIQAYLTAAAINPKRLVVGYLLALLSALTGMIGSRRTRPTNPPAAASAQPSHAFSRPVPDPGPLPLQPDRRPSSSTGPRGAHELRQPSSQDGSLPFPAGSPA
jgi:hypothetical protein